MAKQNKFTMSIPRPHSPYFLVRIAIEEQKKSKEKIGDIFIAPSQTFMMYNKQCGEIVAIGEGAAKYFPEAKVGHTLIFHHGVESSGAEEAKNEHLIYWDEEYNYYVVAAYEYNGKNVEAYAVWDGETIVPNKDYVFLKIEQPEHSDLPADEVINQALVATESGLLLFKEWEDSRENKEAKMADIKKEIEHLSKSGNHKKHIQEGILEKEKEMEKISANINKQSYEPYSVEFANKELSEWFDCYIGEGSVLGILNIAAHTTIKFNEKEYIVTKTRFIAYHIPKLKVA